MNRLFADMRSMPDSSIFARDLPFANDDAAVVTSVFDAYLLVAENGTYDPQADTRLGERAVTGDFARASCLTAYMAEWSPTPGGTLWRQRLRRLLR
jgi:hypothetical protein